ncbi:MAG: diphosphokinase / guanosine-3,5-bis(diphosphate) 3-diphosphatase [Actinomycetota bacterium]|nr:diphosphokinase / guanosine-3,5-bis(diphosphate) 3-diphosphatase [Actinomycetota bacterium]
MAQDTTSGDFLPVAGARRRLSRFGRLTGARQTDPMLEPVWRELKRFHPRSDWDSVERAFEVAAYYHRDQRRRSGEPYITHPVAVASILAELGMTTSTVVAALLHDTVEDTDYTLDMLRADFGDEVGALVDGVTKLDKVKYGSASAAETVRKMVVAMARDIRVLVIKLADRLHNMRTLGAMPPDKQASKARETLEIYAPLAHRLGMNTIKWELEDLAFATLYPKMFEEIERLVSQRAPGRQEYLAKVIAEVDEDLRNSKIKATVTGRPKHYYSIYQKMIVRGRDFNDIYDLVGVRILVDSLRDCYAVLGILHSQFSPVPGRFKDYIAMPKFTMYQSLHTTVIGPEGKPVEMQIRTREMDRTAEYGVAAHWRYKQDEVGGKHGPDDFGWLRQLLEWQREVEDPDEFLEGLSYELSNAETYVFTPDGDVVALPAGSTPVDFAYAVHTEVGHRCVGAKVNSKLVPLESVLANGDVVEIFTAKSDSAGPSQDWLRFVVSSRARSKIRAWYSRERREEAVEKGREALIRGLRRGGMGVARTVDGPELAAIAADMHFPDIAGLFRAVGDHHVSVDTVIERLIASRGGIDAARDDVAEAVNPMSLGRRSAATSNGNVGVIVDGTDDVWVKLAKCCTPVPGDDIVGFVTRGHGVSVHRSDCTNIPQLESQPQRFVAVRWAPTANTAFLVNISVEALDRAGLLSDVTRVLSDQHVNILSATVSTTRDRIAASRFTFEMADPQHLGAVINAVRNVEGVFDAYRA